MLTQRIRNLIKNLAVFQEASGSNTSQTSIVVTGISMVLFCASIRISG